MNPSFCRSCGLLKIAGACACGRPVAGNERARRSRRPGGGGVGIYVTHAPWTPGDDVQLVRMWDEGLTAAEIAELMDRTLSSIRGRIFDLRVAGRVGRRRPA